MLSPFLVNITAFLKVKQSVWEVFLDPQGGSRGFSMQMLEKEITVQIFPSWLWPFQSLVFSLKYFWTDVEHFKITSYRFS